LQAKDDLATFINGMSNKYGISFILINEMLGDLYRQVSIAAKNDKKMLTELYLSKDERNNGDMKDE
jgi:hypothetical protein